MQDGRRERDGPAERIAHQIGLFETQRVQKVNHLLDPGRLVVDEAGRPVREAEARHVGRDDAEVHGEARNDQPPIGPGRNARPRAVDEHHRPAAGP